MRMKANGPFHTSETRTVKGGAEFEVHDALAKELEARGLATPIEGETKAEPELPNKAEPTLENKTLPPLAEIEPKSRRRKTRAEFKDEPEQAEEEE